MSATIHNIRKFPDLTLHQRISARGRMDELEQLKRIVFELREADRELCEDLDNWERELAAIVPRDYKEE